MAARTLDLLVDAGRAGAPAGGVEAPATALRTGALAKYARLVGSAAQGAVCD